MENAAFLFAAYTIIWALVFGFVLVMFNRQKKMRQELESLEKAIKEKKE